MHSSIPIVNFIILEAVFRKVILKKLEYDKNRVENKNEEFRTLTNTARLKENFALFNHHRPITVGFVEHRSR